MRKTLIYDVPTRLFHGLFAVLFLAAFSIGKFVDDESALYVYHMIIGLSLGFLIVLRLVWGFLGSKYARWGSFKLNPKDAIKYFSGILSGSKDKDVGHNPASSWAAILMMALVLGLVFTGYMMTNGLNNKEDFEDIHELLSTSMIILVVLHVLGIILHSLRHKDMIALSMVDGRKQLEPSAEGIKSSHALAGIFMLVLFLSFGLTLLKSYNSTTGQLKFAGQKLQLSEGPEENEGGLNNSEQKEIEQDGDDD